MIGVDVVTHGQLSTELVNAAEMIVGDPPQLTCGVDRLASRTSTMPAKTSRRPSSASAATQAC